MEKYEFEEAQEDKMAAIGSIGTLIIGACGLAIKLLSNYNESKRQDEINMNNSQIQAQIDRKTDQYRALDAKLFKTSAEKAEIKRLKKEISQLESQIYK